MTADVAVIGAGIVGLATAYALTEHGASVALYERGVPGNGQSGGESRIFRHAHDDPRLVALACEARRLWRDWEERFGRELLSRDGVVATGPAVRRRLALLREAGGVRAHTIDAAGAAEWLPLLGGPDGPATGAPDRPAAAEPAEAWHGPAMVDEDGGVIRVRAAIDALTGTLRDALVFDEVISVRALPGGAVEVRAGGGTAEHGAVVVCAGRGTAALARGAGIPLPVRQAAHVRLTFRVRGAPRARLACLQDGAARAYGDPLPGNGAYAVGLGAAPVHDDGSLVEPTALPAAAERIAAYVARSLPGLEPGAVAARHCWVTELPWSGDGMAVWEAGRMAFVAGNNLFKHAPALGRAAARAALGEGLDPRLRPQAKLGMAG